MRILYDSKQPQFKAPFGTAGEAALDGIYVLQALEKRSL